MGKDIALAINDLSSKKSSPSFTNRGRANYPPFLFSPNIQQHHHRCALYGPLEVTPSITDTMAVTTHRVSLPPHHVGLDARQHHMVPTTVSATLRHHREVRYTPPQAVP
ncbi:hypothetical protein ACLOJK_014048 [Asimina triloba]